jgi:hypothetical protein
MTGEEEQPEDVELVQITEHATNIVRGKVSGTVVQLDHLDGDVVFDGGLVIRRRKQV